MISGRVDPAVAKHLRDAASMVGDPYREALSLRAALCAAAVAIESIPTSPTSCCERSAHSPMR